MQTNQATHKPVTVPTAMLACPSCGYEGQMAEWNLNQSELLQALRRCISALREARGGIFDDAVAADKFAQIAIARATGGAV